MKYVIRFLSVISSISIIGLFIYLAWFFENRATIIKYNDFLAAIKNNEIEEVVIDGQKLKIKDKSGNKYFTHAINIQELLPKLLEKNISIYAGHQPKPILIYFFLGIIGFSTFLIIILWLVNKVMREKEESDFAKSRAIYPNKWQKKITFEDVAGISEVKEELEEIVRFLKNPSSVNRLGGRIPKGVLLMGPPGTGKTLLAKAIAGEAGVPFFSISGSDFVEMYVGVGASRVRELFKEAKKHTPCIIFIDEIDAVGKHRGAGDTISGNDERQQTLNALLVEMDGFESEQNIIVLAATNRPDVLDPALLRPGRFDRRINILPPDVKGRIKILEVHTKNVVISPDIDLEQIAKSIPGFTGADIKNLVNEAALIAAKNGKDKIELSDFEAAKDKIILGVERKGMVMSEIDRKLSAYHEAGHAIVAKMLPESDPIHKITIVPRGMAIGVTQQSPADDYYSHTKEYLLNRIKILLGGRAAEEIIFQRQTTLSKDDLAKVNDIATKMVCEFGMSEKLGPFIGHYVTDTFLGWSSKPKYISEEMAAIADKEIKNIIDSCYNEAKSILKNQEENLRKIAEVLLITETMDQEDINIIFECSQKLKNLVGDYPDECSVCVNAPWCEKKDKKRQQKMINNTLH